MATIVDQETCILPMLHCSQYHVNTNEMSLLISGNETKWRKISDEFYVRWNFSICIGAMNGKHIVIRPPRNLRSYYFNYKWPFSLVLLAVVKTDYKFVYVGCNGRISYGGVCRSSSLYTAMEGNCLNTPESEPLPRRSMSVPFAFVVDDAFPLKNYIQKEGKSVFSTID